MQFGTKEEPTDLMVQQVLEEFDDAERKNQHGGVVSWSPPQQNWNPWIAANIDEGPLAHVINFVVILCLKPVYISHFSWSRAVEAEKSYH